MRTRYATLAALLIALAAPSGASAVTFCVHSPDGCTGTTQPSLSAALSAAAANGGGRDEIRVGVGLFNDGPAVNAAGSPVDIVGVAANKTAITTNSATPGMTILSIQEPTSTISHLRVHHKTNAPTAVGIALAGDADDVMVTNQGVVGQFDAIRAVGTGATIDESSVSLVYPADLQNRAVFAPTGTELDIDDSYLEATVGVATASSQVSLDRTRIDARQGVVAGGGATIDVRDTEIKVPGSMPSNFQAAALAAAGSGAATVDADRVTAYSEDGTGYGVWVVPNDGAGNTSTVELHGSILDGFSVALRLSEGGGSSAVATTDWSAFSLGSVSQTGSPSYTAGAHMTNLASVDPKFRNAPQGDLRLLHDSPLIDAGDPAFQPFLGGLDVALLTRVRDGDGSGGPGVVDLGAHEYQRRAPVADALAEPATVAVGQAATFSAAESEDVDDDPLSFSWSFDDGAASTGELAQHAFATPGQHQATVTVTDVTGLSHSATVIVTVTADPATPAGPAATLPEIRDLRVTPRKFRAAGKAKATAKRPPVGTKIRYRLTAAADVQFAVQRKTTGRRAGGRCGKPTRANRGGKRCVRWVNAGGFRHRGVPAGDVSRRFSGRIGRRALKPGRYRLTAIAATAMGSKSNPSLTTFVVSRPEH